MTVDDYTSEYRSRGGSHGDWDTNVSADKESERDELKRRLALFEETGIPYDPKDYVRGAMADAKALKGSGDSRDKAHKKDATKRVHEAFSKQKLSKDTHIEEHHDDIVAAVELAYAKDQENNTPAKMSKLGEINKMHTKRVLDREMQEDTALDGIRAKKTVTR